MDTPERYIDLHTHSTASDGTCTPAELVALARETGLAAVALTDHDTTAGIPEFLEAGRNAGDVETIPGVELSTRYGAREIHIVGLFIDHQAEPLRNFLAREQAKRVKRNRDMKIKLALLGYPLDDDEPAFIAAGGMKANLGRPHFAQAIVEKYPDRFSDLRAVFAKLLGDKGPGYIPREHASPREAIEAVRSAGGVPVWAHPVTRNKNERAFALRVARKLAALGLGGIEGYYSLFGPPETQMITEIAATLGLALSGGSDFHGRHKPEIALGTGMGKLRVPARLLDALRPGPEMTPPFPRH